MEDELWKPLYQLLIAESKRHFRKKHVWYSDTLILTVFLWAVLHDRPISWACRLKHWPPDQQGRTFPSPATLSRRMRSFSVLSLLAALLLRLGEIPHPPLVRVIDAKPLPVGGFSKDKDARWGQAVDAKAKGYKIFAIWSSQGAAPEHWRLGSMNVAEPVAAAALIPRLPTGGYLLGDALYDTNLLYSLCDDQGLRLL